ncbi:T9SS type A sorting domain-containing protein [Flavobacterium columnare]|uniref:T9SS C-terminal target domain-containing protein n=1 Tax=Flavobacterium columnare TaxID=996 RepID=A0AA94JP15_9FLAO|nr:T9SS type A sorting domain-containing protein [Flavobacterium columnare]MCH4829943.1 T9SS type A sorting domain-containing protein [Flavobacterium columnare]MCH4832677.1 T9SS type A sorting domain-containing protein [Flavobacterium columnare]
MKKKSLFSLFSLFLFISNSFAQTTLTSWSFDGQTTNPNLGTGTLSLIGGVSPNTYQSGNGGGFAHSIKNFPLQGTASGTAGYQFMASTNGYSGIIIKFDPRGQDASSKWQQYEYTFDGGNSWEILTNNNGDLTNGFTTSPMKSLLINDPRCNNNPNFGFRIVSIVNPNNNTYEPILGVYDPTANWRIDNVKIEASSVLNNEKNNEIEGLSVHPNPANSVLNITSGNFEEKQIEVYNTWGKKTLSTKVTDQTVNISSLTKGIYFAKITEKGKTATRKIIVE